LAQHDSDRVRIVSLRFGEHPLDDGFLAAGVAAAGVLRRPLFVEATENDFGRPLAGQHGAEHGHLLAGDLAQHRHGPQVIRMPPQERKQMLLALPRTRVIAALLFDANELADERHLIERVQAAVDPNDLNGPFQGGERERVIVPFHVEQPEVRQRREQIARVRTVA
jgi:hypothetical protein